MGFVTMFSNMYTMHFNQIHPSASCVSPEGDYSQTYIYNGVAFHFINCEPLQEASYQDLTVLSALDYLLDIITYMTG